MRKTEYRMTKYGSDSIPYKDKNLAKRTVHPIIYPILYKN